MFQSCSSLNLPNLIVSLESIFEVDRFSNVKMHFKTDWIWLKISMLIFQLELFYEAVGFTIQNLFSRSKMPPN